MLFKDSNYGISPALMLGIRKISDAVRVTFGPKGKLVGFMQDNKPFFTKDGITVARKVYSDDFYENYAIEIVKEAALKTLKEAGDGTSTTVLLIGIICQTINELKIQSTVEGPLSFPLLDTEILINSLNALEQELLSFDKIDDSNVIRNVARVSCNNEKEIYETIEKAINYVGEKGYLVLEKNRYSSEDIFEENKGFLIESGFVTHHFINNSAKGSCELENPYILIYPGGLPNFTSIQKLLSIAYENNKPLFIMAESFEGSALAGLVENHTRGKINCCAVKLPFEGFTASMKIEFLRDLSVFCQTNIFYDTDGFDIRNIKKEDLGTCEKIIIKKDNSFIKVDREVENKELENYISSLEALTFEKSQKEIVDFDFLKKRIAMLRAKSGTIYVSGKTDSEISERSDRYEDAICSVFGALEEGVTKGGFSHFSSKITGDDKMLCGLQSLVHLNDSKLDDEFKIDFIKAHLKEKIKTLQDLIGVEPEEWVIDSIKVLRKSIENSFSACRIFLRLNCILENIQKEKQQARFTLLEDKN